MVRDRQRDDLAAEVPRTASAAKAAAISAAGQNRKAAVTPQRRSPRSTREVIQQHEDKQRDLITALSDLGGPVEHELAGRLHCCQQAREVRRGWSNQGGAALNAYPYQCRFFACWACRRSIIRHWQDKARQRLAGAANSASTVIDIAPASTTRIDVVGSIIGKARKDFGNMRAAAYQQPGGWRWRSVQMFGIVEPDVAALAGATPLMPDRSTLIPCLPVVAPAGNMLWRPCANLAVHHPHLDRAELARAVMHQWPGSGRVSLFSFESHQTAADGVSTMVGSMLEGFERTGFNGADSRRTARWHAQFQSWLFGLRRGLQPLGMSSKAQRNSAVSNVGHEVDLTHGSGLQGAEIEPMPVLF